jgi:hypothetical protein
MAIIKNNPTFNRSFNPGTRAGAGYHSRTIFTYQANGATNLAVADPAQWCTEPNGNGIQMFINNNYGLTHGDAILPGKYWRPGKTLRIKGTLSARAEVETNGNPTYLNLRFGLKEFINNTTTIFAIQNNNNNHIFSVSPDAAIVVPYTSITFCQAITCTEIDMGGTDVIKFSSYGYYQYSYGTEADLLTDYIFTYVPVWDSAKFNYGVNLDYYNGNTQVIINGYDTTTGGVALYEVFLHALTIEELA